MPFFPPQPPPTRREQYEKLLGEVLYEVHALVQPCSQTMYLDDSKVHTLVQRLKDEFGPEVIS